MRVAVAAHGERVSLPWWRTEFLTPAGVASMAMLFPHAGVSSAVRAACEAARELHDARVAKHKRFHLFRLPVAQERAVAALVSSSEYADDIRSILAAGDEALRRVLSDATDANQSPEGVSWPVLIGQAHGALAANQVAPVRCAARMTRRPMRPKPLMATLVVARFSKLVALQGGSGMAVPWASRHAERHPPRSRPRF
jgi:hypothetical protein